MELDLEGNVVEADGTVVLPDGISSVGASMTYDFEPGKLYSWVIYRLSDAEYEQREIFGLVVNLSATGEDVIISKPLTTLVGRPYTADYTTLLFVQSGPIILVDNGQLGQNIIQFNVELTNNFTSDSVTLTLVDGYDFSISNNYDFEKYIPAAPDEDLEFIIEQYGLSLSGVPNNREAIRAGILAELRQMINAAIESGEV